MRTGVEFTVSARTSPCKPAANIDAIHRTDRLDTRTRSARRLEWNEVRPVSPGASTQSPWVPAWLLLTGHFSNIYFRYEN